VTGAGRIALLLGSLLACGCATGAPSTPRESLRAAVADLEQDDFPSARAALVEALSGCGSGEDGQRAMLLFAAAQIDPANPDGSAREAALAAARYLTLANPAPHERVLARVLYRIAVDEGGTIDGAQASSDGLPSFPAECRSTRPSAETAPLPPFRKPSTADRIRALQRQARVQADSLGALEAEIQRITNLLTDGVHASPDRSHR